MLWIQFLERYVIDNFRFCVAFNDNILSLLQNFELPIHNVLTEWDTCGAPLLELCISSRKDNMRKRITHNQNPVTEKVLEYINQIDDNYNRALKDKKYKDWNMSYVSFTFNFIKALKKRLEHDPNISMNDNEWSYFEDLNDK